jgi:hypothetical protein
MPHDVFISYASHDKSVADALCAALEAQNVRCWIAPRDVLAGTEYGEAIVSAIEDCRAMVLVFSAHADGSPHIHKEVDCALNKGKTIIPFRIENVPLSKALEYALGNTHWLDALTPPIERHIGVLVSTVRRLLGDEGGKPMNGRKLRTGDLIDAAHAGDVGQVKALLAAGADANARNADGGTALMAAAGKGHLEVVQALLAARADANAKADKGYTALTFAASSGHLKVVQALLAAGADVNAKREHGVTALMLASENGYREIVQAFLAAKAEVNAKDAKGMTALMGSSLKGHQDVVQALLAAGADANARTDKGVTALMLAGFRCHEGVVRLLKKAGAK